MSRPLAGRAWWVLVVYTGLALLALTARFEVASLGVPVAGPWAGHLFGHADCTMATQFPTLSVWGLVAAPLVLGLAVGCRRWVAVVPLALWGVPWGFAGLLSAVNTLS